MASWVCAACTTVYTVGAPACPHCGSADRSREGGSVLPTIEVACETTGCATEGTPRRVMLRRVAVGLVEMPALLCAGCGMTPRIVRPWPPLSDQEADMPKITRHGGATNRLADPPAAPTEEVPSSPGNSSATSSEKPSTSPETSKPANPRHARTTGSRSSKPRTARTARSTGGAQTGRTSATGSDNDS